MQKVNLLNQTYVNYNDNYPLLNDDYSYDVSRFEKKKFILSI